VTNALTYNASTNPDTILAMASGALEAAIIRGNRYLVTDLTNLANTPGNGSAYLASLVADYAMWILLNRRPNRQAPIPQQVQAAFQLYEKLANGEMVLPFLETLAAGDHFERIAQPLTLAALVTDRGHRYFGQLDGCFGPRRC
jgi:hypothetical protein